MNICLENDFLRKLECHFPDTKLKDLREYLTERTCQAVRNLNSVRSDFTVRDVHFGISICCPRIPINIDRAWPKCQVAYLKVQPEIVRDPICGTKRLSSATIQRHYEGARDHG